MRKIRWGIVGPGTIAHEFAHDFQFVQNAELLAVASTSVERGTEFARKFGISRNYTDYASLYNDQEIDIVYVATPHVFHLPNCTEALMAGKAVLCEKPLTVNPIECRSLLNTASTTNNYLMEGMWTYFLPAIRKAREWVDDGIIGRIRQVKADFGYPVPFDPKSRMYNPELAGGALLDMGIYTLAINWLFVGETPKSMYVKSTKAKTGVDEEVIVACDYGKSTAVLTTSFRCKLHNWAFIIGEKGYIAIPDFWRARECQLYVLEECVDSYVDDRPGFGFNYEIEAVSKDLTLGRKASSTVPHELSALLQDWMDKIRNEF